MRNLRYMVAVACSALLGLGACKGTEPEPAHAFSGTYEMRTMDGHAIPYDYHCMSGSTQLCTMLGGRVEVRPDSLVVVAHYVESHYFIGVDTMGGTYTFKRSGNQVILSIVPTSQVQEETRVYNVHENSVQSGIFVYVKSDTVMR